MSPRGVPRLEPMTTADAKVRARHARAFLDVADLVVADDTDLAQPSVAGSLAVMAAIAASDAICGISLGERPRGDDHNQAVGVLRQVAPDGPKLAQDLKRCLDDKSNSQYGLRFLTASKAQDLVTRARRLVEAAERLP